LYDRHSATAYRVAYRVTRSEQLAETVVQEVFLTVWRQADRFDARRARPATWLLTIAHHKAVDAVRVEQRRRTEPADRIVEEADASVDLPREAWLGVQRERVRAALATLPAAQREIIELAYFGGHTQTQVARLLGQPLGTVKSRTRTALARLRALLELEGFTPESELAVC
jgi:RNA polymerase sigma-70 factor (ECF subfamily)